MIRKVTLLVAILMLGSLLAAAQESASKFDLYGGYSYLNGDVSGLDRFSLNGWSAQGSYNFSRWLGLTADFGGYYGSPYGHSMNDYTFMFGPTVSIRTPRVTPFFHALFGVDRFHENVIGGSGTDSSFAMAVGGGLDVPVKGIVSIRVAQLDWLRTDHFSTGQNNIRVSAGVVFRFGE